MSRIRGFRELIWPLLEPLTPEEEREKADSYVEDSKKVALLDLHDEPDVALDEARRYASSEDDRRRSADQKATTYLVVASALVPLILTLASGIWDKKAGPAPTWVNMFVLGVAVLYVTFGALWSFRVLEVATSARVGAMDIYRIWQRPHPSEKLARQIIQCARANHDGVNRKVSSIKMAHAHLWRALLTFSCLLLLNIGWYLLTPVVSALSAPADPWMASPESATRAISKIDRLQQKLVQKPADVVLRDECGTAFKGGGRFEAVTVSNRPLPLQSEPPGLAAHTHRQVRLRVVQLRCNGIVVANEKIWAADAPDHQLRNSSGSVQIQQVARSWPPLSDKVPARLPDVLLRQLARTDGSTTSALIETSVMRGALGPAP